MMRAVHGSTVVSMDANQDAQLVVAMADLPGSPTSAPRAKYPILTGGGRVPIGGSRVVRGGGADDEHVVESGLTARADRRGRARENRVGSSDRSHSVKPLDAAASRRR